MSDDKNIAEIRKQLEKPFAAHETWWHSASRFLLDALDARNSDSEKPKVFSRDSE